MSDVWFTSDTHYHHKRISEYARRPFSHVEVMNEVFVENWNRVVKPGDIVFHLGDFSFGTKHQATDVAQRLLGEKHIIWGNHDDQVRDHPAFLACWASHADLRVLNYRKQSITLCHYAMRVWRNSHYDAWQLYGHSHGSLRPLPGLKQLDVGVDNWDYTPVSFDQVKERMDKITYAPQDRHGT